MMVARLANLSTKLHWMKSWSQNGSTRRSCIRQVLLAPTNATRGGIPLASHTPEEDSRTLTWCEVFSNKPPTMCTVVSRPAMFALLALLFAAVTFAESVTFANNHRYVFDVNGNAIDSVNGKVQFVKDQYVWIAEPTIDSKSLLPTYLG